MNLYDTWLVKEPLSHRGMFNKEFPENTLGAFQNAIYHGYGCELDVQMTTDGVLVVFHDYDMMRLCGVKGDIREKSWSEIKDLKVNGTKYSIPTFKEVLDLVNDQIPLLIEVKHHKNIGKMEDLIIEALRNYKGRYIMESFNPFIVRYFYKHAPEIIRGQLSCTFDGDDVNPICKVLLRYLVWINYNHSDFLAYDVDDIKRPQILRIKKRMPVVMWTVRDPKKLEITKGYYDNYIFEGYDPKDIK